MLCALGCAWTAAARAQGGRADQVFQRHREQVVQVRVLDRTAGSKAGIGSGFVAGAADLIVTNYHVISGLVLRPAQYRAEYRTELGTGGDLHLIAVDVVHDLAVLRADHAVAVPLPLAAAPPAQGQRLFSMGNPYDLGLTIVEGTYNGRLKKSLYDKMHFTGSINPGMSGGPAVDAGGTVVGVNVATAGDQVSFLVPAAFAAALLRTAPGEGTATGDLLGRLAAQLYANQDAYLTPLLTADLASLEIGDYRVPGELAPYVSCWGDTPEREPGRYRLVYQSCSSTDDVFVSDGLEVGSIRFRHERFETAQGDALRFYRHLEEHFQNPHLGFGGGSTDATRFECRTGVIRHRGVTAKVVFCVRGYRELPGLYDAFLTATTLDRTDAALHTSLALTGVSFDNAAAFSRAYLEAIRWVP